MLKVFILYLNCIFNEYFAVLRYERFRSGRTVHGVNNGVSFI